MHEGASSGAPALRRGTAAATTTQPAASAAAAALSGEIGRHSVQLSVPEYCLTASRELLHAVLGCGSFRVAVRTARVLLSLYELLTAADDGTGARVGSDEESLVSAAGVDERNQLLRGITCSLFRSSRIKKPGTSQSAPDLAGGFFYRRLHFVLYFGLAADL